MFLGHFLLLFKTSIPFLNLPLKLLKYRLPLFLLLFKTSIPFPNFRLTPASTFYFFLDELIFVHAPVQSVHALSLLLPRPPAAYES
jgi:hypothetical protein